MSIWDSALTKAIRRQANCCLYCGCNMRSPRKHGSKRATADHYIPRSRGGDANNGNIVAACLACNNAKADRDAVEFMAMAWLLRRISWVRAGQQGIDEPAPYSKRAEILMGLHQ